MEEWYYSRNRISHPSTYEAHLLPLPHDDSLCHDHGLTLLLYDLCARHLSSDPTKKYYRIHRSDALSRVVPYRCHDWSDILIFLRKALVADHLCRWCVLFRPIQEARTSQWESIVVASRKEEEVLNMFDFLSFLTILCSPPICPRSSVEEQQPSKLKVTGSIPVAGTMWFSKILSLWEDFLEFE